MKLTSIGWAVSAFAGAAYYLEKTAKEALLAQVRGLESRLRSTAADRDSWKVRADELGARVGDLTGRVDGLTKQVAVLRTELETSKAELTRLNAEKKEKKSNG